MALLNFLVRNEPDSMAQTAVLVTNLISHILEMVVDLLAVSQGLLMIGRVVPGMIVHLFIGIGSLIYILKIKA